MRALAEDRRPNEQGRSSRPRPMLPLRQSKVINTEPLQKPTIEGDDPTH